MSEILNERVHLDFDISINILKFLSITDCL